MVSSGVLYVLMVAFTHSTELMSAVLGPGAMETAGIMPEKLVSSAILFLSFLQI